MKYLQLGVLLIISSFVLSCTEEDELGSEVGNEVYYEVTDFTDSVFTGGIEGPAYRDGELYAVNYKKEGTIGVVDKSGKVKTFLTLPEGSVGNGIRFSADGTMFIADYPKHNILKVSKGTQVVEVFAHSDQMNQPNDIAIMKDGTLFASDPNWGNETGNLWLISKQGVVSLVESDMGTTNGVEVSNDEKYLYVNESVQRKVWRYDIGADKKLTNKTLFHEFTDFGMDGMRCDVEGNLYVARYGKGVVAILSSKGELIREVDLPGSNPTNVAFGGTDFRTIYVALQSKKKVVSFLNEKAGRSSLF